MDSSRGALLVWVFLAAIASLNAVLPVMGTCPEKNPCHRSHGGGGYYSSPKPRSSCPSSTPAPKKPSPSPCSMPPSSSSPCHKGGSSSTPAPNPPSTTPSPSVPSTTPTPSVPSTTPTPSVPTPSVPSTTPTPSVPSTTPTPLIPLTPGVPPLFTHPFIGTCDFWRTHPELITPIINYWSSIGNVFGTPPITSLFGGNIPTFPQALSCPITSGYGALLRECAASLLNSLVRHPNFPFSTSQVQRSFYESLSSAAAAAAQAELFKAANEGRFH